MNEESWMREQQTYPVNSKLGRQHTKAPLAAALSPFMSLLYPPNPFLKANLIPHKIKCCTYVCSPFFMKSEYNIIFESRKRR